jgi:hypothetical protein
LSPDCSVPESDDEEEDLMMIFPANTVFAPEGDNAEVAEI